MPIYVYRNPQGDECEVMAHTYEPEKYSPGPEWKQVFFPSMLVFGDFILGDDDFSRRYHLNGDAGKYGAKPNNSQGKTNVNPHIRKYGTKGLPLESRKDIDPNSMTNIGQKVPGVPDTSAPEALRSSSAKGITLDDLR